MKNGLFQSPIYTLTYLFTSWWPILELAVMKMDADRFGLEEAERLPFKALLAEMETRELHHVTR